MAEPNRFGHYPTGGEPSPEIPKAVPNKYGHMPTGAIPEEPGIIERTVEAAGPAIETFNTAVSPMTGGITMPEIGEVAASVNKNVLEFVDLLGAAPSAIAGGLEGLRVIMNGGTLDEAVSRVHEVAAVKPPSARAAIDALAESVGQGTTAAGFVEDQTSREMFQATGPAVVGAAGMRAVPGRDLAKLGDAVAEYLGFGAAGPVSQVARAVPESIQGVPAALKETVTEATKPLEEAVGRAVKPVVKAVKAATPQGKAAKAAELPLLRESGDTAAAGFRLNEAGEVVADVAQKAAIGAGVKPGVVAMIKAMPENVKENARKMVKILATGRQNELFRARNRPAKVIGDEIAGRARAVLAANKGAGSQIDTIAKKTLKGKPFQAGTMADDFAQSLESEGISVVDGALDFTDSTIKGSKKNQKILQDIYQDAKNLNNKDSYGAHIFKRYLDNQVSYGKTKHGLDGRMEARIKDLRRSVDSVLDSMSPDYDEVNQVYAGTREALDNMQRSAGTRIDLTGDKADSAIGALSRSLLSNNRSRVELETSIEEIAEAASRYGGAADTSIDEIMAQVAFANELERLFGAFADTGFAGDTAKGTTQGMRDVAEIGPMRALGKKGMELLESATGQTEEDQIKALMDLLK